VTLEVWGEDIALPTFIATFAIRFEPAVVEFVDFEPGDFFEQQALHQRGVHGADATSRGGVGST
jgi:hypothetical protein